MGTQRICLRGTQKDKIMIVNGLCTALWQRLRGEHHGERCRGGDGERCGDEIGHGQDAPHRNVNPSSHCNDSLCGGCLPGCDDDTNKAGDDPPEPYARLPFTERCHTARIKGRQSEGGRQSRIRASSVSSIAYPHLRMVESDLNQHMAFTQG